MCVCVCEGTLKSETVRGLNEMENAIPNYISASTYAKLPLSLSLSLSLCCCLHTLLPHLAWAVVAAIVAPRPQDERSSRPSSTASFPQPALPTGRFVVQPLLFICVYNTTKSATLAPGYPPPPSSSLFPASVAGMAAAKLVGFFFPLSVTCHNLHVPLSSRLLLVMTAMST